jgi:hypothetical protein
LFLAFLIGAAFGVVADLLGLDGIGLVAGWALTITASVVLIVPWALVRRPVPHPAIDLGPGPAFQLRMLWRSEDLIQVSESGIADTPHRSPYSSEFRRDSRSEITGSWS